MYNNYTAYEITHAHNSTKKYYIHASNLQAAYIVCENDTMKPNHIIMPNSFIDHELCVYSKPSNMQSKLCGAW